jgi:hypothetical protein
MLSCDFVAVDILLEFFLMILLKSLRGFDGNCMFSKSLFSSTMLEPYCEIDYCLICLMAEGMEAEGPRLFEDEDEKPCF